MCFIVETVDVNALFQKYCVLKEFDLPSKNVCIHPGWGSYLKFLHCDCIISNLSSGNYLKKGINVLSIHRYIYTVVYELYRRDDYSEKESITAHLKILNAGVGSRRGWPFFGFSIDCILTSDESERFFTLVKHPAFASFKK